MGLGRGGGGGGGSAGGRRPHVIIAEVQAAAAKGPASVKRMALPDGGRASSVSVTKRVGPAEAVRAAWYAFSTAMAEGKVSYRRAHANRQFDRRQNAHIIYHTVTVRLRVQSFTAAANFLRLVWKHISKP